MRAREREKERYIEFTFNGQIKGGGVKGGREKMKRNAIRAEI